MTVSTVTRGELGPDEVTAVLALVDAVTEHDGGTPVSEHVLLHLRHGGDRRAVHLLVHDDGVLVGYAHLDTTDRVAGPSAEMAVLPDARRHGVGNTLLAELERQADRCGGQGRLRLWAHGRHPGAQALARGRGYVQERELFQMRRSLIAQLPDAPQVPGVRIRAFVVGRDEAAWLAVNNRAFADHPEQGGWGLDELLLREKEPWFDPEGFLLAERVGEGSLAGFHWTKVHGANGRHGHAPIGEVYVVGVDPSAQGTGLGRALTVAGLRHLRGRGLAQVMLYVDASNTSAIALYTRLGFTRWDVDVQYRRS